LYIGSSGLLEITILSLLVIAYDHKNTDWVIQDPEHDTNYLCEEFKKLDNVLFKSLSDDDATLARIDETITSLWKEAPARAHLLLLLTGHGRDNAMILHKDELIDESYLNQLFQRLHQNSPRELRVTIVFDICRNNPKKKAMKMDDRVALIWSCSPSSSIRSECQAPFSSLGSLWHHRMYARTRVCSRSTSKSELASLPSSTVMSDIQRPVTFAFLGEIFAPKRL
jgi:hypothetical protein